MKVITGAKRVPIKMWLDDLEEGAYEQAQNLASLPFIHKHVAIMPDSHQGYGMPIGGVIACVDVVIPNAVGVDIGCGMCMTRTDQTHLHDHELQRIVAEIQMRVPTGFSKHYKAQKMPTNLQYDAGPVIDREWANAAKSLGTLGGGNHFIEIQRDKYGFYYIMLHSGSRNVGKQVADHYNRVAQTLNERWSVSVPKSHGLAFLPESCTEGLEYLVAMNWCVQFAKFNRQAMMLEVQQIFKDCLPQKVTFTKPLDVAHNYARSECHYGKTVVVHRKGATSARKDELGIIPGSQGTSSYIVKGLGNPLSFDSCSHGAGRKMSRRKARAELDLETQQALMDVRGIVHNMRHKDQLDEAPAAYKDIDVVMENQQDLVEIVTQLKPVAVIKG
jgi:tRNA-splicing ligase RtcB